MCVFVHAGVCASPAILAVPHLPGRLHPVRASSTSPSSSVSWRAPTARRNAQLSLKMGRKKIAMLATLGQNHANSARKLLLLSQGTKLIRFSKLRD